MSNIAATMQAFLQKHGISFDVLTHARTDSLADVAELAHIPSGMIARAVMLGSGSDIQVVVLPLNYILDFMALEKLTGRTWSPIPAAKSSAHFQDCETGSVPVLANAYDIPVLLDKSLLQAEIIVFEGGVHSTLIRLRQEDFRRLVPEDAFGSIAQHENILERGLESVTEEHNEQMVNFTRLTPSEETRNAFKRVYELPVLPQHVQKILQLRDDPRATPRQLAELVEQDASLAAQVMRYARSPYFGIGDQVKDIRDAITIALGFDMVMNIALGLAAFGTFKTPADGPLGLKAMGRHSLLSATLAKLLVQQYHFEVGVSAGEAYLAGLVHNLGYLLYSHLFQPEFFLLNRMVQANPRLPVTLVEKRVLVPGHAHEMMRMGHDHAGSMLLEYWDMSPAIVTACHEHHNAEYQGLHKELAHLLYLIDCLLKARNLGDANTVEVPENVMATFHLEPAGLDEIQREIDQLLESGGKLDQLLSV